MTGFSSLFHSQGKVYMFHSIGDNRHEMNVSEATFMSFLETLRDKNVIRLEEWEKQDRFVCLTFDDVADSFYYNAFPLLKKYSYPFTIFVSCSLLDTDGFLTTSMLKEIAECKLCTVGSHGWDHSFFADFSSAKAFEDLRFSKDKLEGITHKQIGLYAFPFGSIFACGLGRKKLVRRCYEYGFGTIKAPLTRPRLLPTYYLPRIAVTEDNVRSIT